MSEQIKKKKIIWLAHESNLSGANIALLEWIDVLKEDYTFHIIVPHEGNMQTALATRRIATTVIYQYSWSGTFCWWQITKLTRLFGRSLIAMRQTKALLKREHTDLVFTNTIVPFIGALAAYRLNIPHVWWIHEFGIEDFGIRIGWGHDSAAYAQMKKWSKLIICNSDAVEKNFKTYMPGADIRRLYQPVSWDENCNAPKKKIARYIMFGQMIKSKGHFGVLEALHKAFQLNPEVDFSLHIKGPCEDNSYYESLKEFICTNNLDFVSLERGFFKKEDILPNYEVLIMASDCEAFGRIVIEAQKAGLKTIIKNKGGVKELTKNGNGVLYSNEKELINMFTGQTPIPASVGKLPYEEVDEIERLKGWLDNL